MKRLALLPLAALVMAACGDTPTLVSPPGGGAVRHGGGTCNTSFATPTATATPSGSSVAISWSTAVIPAGCEGHVALAGYAVDIRTTGGTGVVSNDLVTSGTSKSYHGLVDGTYEARVHVKATDNAHNSQHSAWAPFTISTAGVTGTQITDVSGSGTYGGTATLKATLTESSSGNPVSGRTIGFTLGGAAVCGGGTGVTCPTTDATGVATLAGVSISGYVGGVHSGVVGASFAGDATHGSSNGTGPLTVVYRTDGYLAPIPSPTVTGPRAFKAGSVIPVKFQLKDAGGNPIPDALAQSIVTQIYAFQGSGMPSSGEVSEDAGNSADTGNRFRYDADADQFVFNLATEKSWSGVFRIYTVIGNGLMTIDQPVTIR